LYSDFDEGYQYQCELCKKEVNKSAILKCDICGRQLCDKCDKEGICLDHYNSLSYAGKKEYDKYLKKFKEIDNKFNNFYLLLFCLFCIFILIALISGFIYNLFIIAIVFSICYILILILIFVTGFLQNKKLKLFKVERLKIYQAYSNNLNDNNTIEFV